MTTPDPTHVRIFVGYDPREAVAFHVLSHSIHARASTTVSITPLMLSELDGLMWRERHDVFDKVRDVRTPVLQLHGEKDEAVPIAWARALFELLQGPKRFVSYPDGEHMDLLEHGAVDEIVTFVESLR